MQPKSRLQKWLPEIASFLLIFLFIWTGLDKLTNLHDFTKQINAQPFDNRYTPFLVIALPTAELFTATLLIFLRTRFYGYIISSLLMIIFTGYVGLAMAGAFAKTPCSCAGAISSMTWPQHLMFNTFFLLTSIAGLSIEAKALRIRAPKKINYQSV